MTEQKKETKYYKLTTAFEDLGGDSQTFSSRFRKPVPAEISRAQQAIGKNPLQGSDSLCRVLIHEDDKQGYIDAAREFPGIADTYATQILKSCGFNSLGK